jgi:hypothetical protein
MQFIMGVKTTTGIFDYAEKTPCSLLDNIYVVFAVFLAATRPLIAT